MVDISWVWDYYISLRWPAAILQVRYIDDSLDEALKTLAKKERRSISQEVIMMIESYISKPKKTALESTKELLN